MATTTVTSGVLGAGTLSTSAGKQDRIDYYVFSANTIHSVATIDLLGTA